MFKFFFFNESILATESCINNLKLYFLKGKISAVVCVESGHVSLFFVQAWGQT